MTTEQVLVLCLMRFAEPVHACCSWLLSECGPNPRHNGQVAFSLIFPFISQFIEDLKVTDDPSRIGYYAGIIVRYSSSQLPVAELTLALLSQESLFAFTTFSTVLAWGRLSDRIGRSCSSSTRWFLCDG